MALDLGITAPEDAKDARELLTIARTKKTLNGVTRDWCVPPTCVWGRGNLELACPAQSSRQEKYRGDADAE